MSHMTQPRKIPVSYSGPLPRYLLPLKLSVILINYLASTMLPKPRSCGSSSSLHSPTLLWPDPLPLPLQVFLSSLLPTHHPSPATSLILSFPTLSLWLTFLKQPPPSHHFPFSLLLLHLFCWSTRVGEEEQEMMVGDSLSPCQVAALVAGDGNLLNTWGAGDTRARSRSRRETKCGHHQRTAFGKGGVC